jgi:tRNA isopentenyl-2-thiomethyl-A-37 hydroxylase MiaE
VSARDEFTQVLRDACLTARQIAYVLLAADEYAAAMAEECARPPCPPGRAHRGEAS